MVSQKAHRVKTSRLLLFAVLFASPACAQSMSGDMRNMPRMATPKPSAKATSAPKKSQPAKDLAERAAVAASGAVREVGDLTLGGVRDWQVADQVKFGVGASYAFDFVPSSIVPSYDNSSHGAMGFFRFVLD